VHPQQSRPLQPPPGPPDQSANLPLPALLYVCAVEAALDCGQNLHALQLHTQVQEESVVRWAHASPAAGCAYGTSVVKRGMQLLAYYKHFHCPLLSPTQLPPCPLSILPGCCWGGLLVPSPAAAYLAQ
jgi:hypothetical protein